MNREGKKCVLYPRVSTEMQVDGYSLEGQKNSLKRFTRRLRILSGNSPPGCRESAFPHDTTSAPWGQDKLTGGYFA